VNENPAGKGPIQIPTIQQANGRIVLTQAGGGQYFACQSSTTIGGNNPSCAQGPPNINWAIYLNGNLCATGCGSVVPPTTPAGVSTTYVAPKGLPLSGETFTLVATSADDSTEFSTALVTVEPCISPSPMCGEFSFLMEGFDANGKPAAAAGHFAATGLANNDFTQSPPAITEITDGVMDINDVDGLDAGVQIISGTYTFDKDPTGALLPNLNVLTGTITLNTSSTIPSHKQRTYAFTATGISGGGSLIEFEASQIGTSPAPNPAAGFQGSGSLWGGTPPGPFAFPADVSGRSNCTANPANTPPSNCNYSFGFAGAGSSGPLGVAGVFNVSVDSNNNCVLSSGAKDVVRNQPGGGILPQPPVQGSLSGNCGTITTFNNVPVADDVNGRGTATVSFAGSASETLAYYVVPGAGLVFLDITAPGATLSGRAVATGLSSATPLTTLGCGTLLVFSGIENCVAYTSGSLSGSVALTLAQFTCPNPNLPSSCNEPLPPIPNNTLTGKLRITQDQMAGGMCNGASLGGPCGPPKNIAGSYTINTTTGVGFICMDTNSPPCPNGATDSHAFTYAGGFLLANDATAATGHVSPQFFFCVSPCVAPQPFDNNDPGPFVGATIPASLTNVPNVTGSFALSAPAAPSTTPCTTANNLNSDALYASGLAPSPFTLSIPATPQISGCFAFDNANPLGTGRGTGTSSSPGPAAFIFYEATPGPLLVMETDNAIPGGQVLLNMSSQSAELAITSESSTTFTVGSAGTFTVTATGSFPVGMPPIPTPPTLTAGPVPLPNSITFIDNKNGTAALTKPAGTGTPGTYLLTVVAHNLGAGAVPGCSPQGSDACQTFVLTVQ